MLLPAATPLHAAPPQPKPALPGWQANVFAELPGDVRLLVEDSSGALIASGYRDGVIWRLLPDADGDGRTDGIRVLAKGLNLPHGLELDDGWLYVAEEHRVVRFRYRDGKLTGAPQVVLTGMPRGGHVSRTIRKGPDGFFFVSIGSSCNICMEKHPWRAAIIRFRVNDAGKAENVEIYAKGLRNAVGFDWRPGTGEMYAVNAGSDWMGDDRPREEVNRIVRGGHYGWPFVHEYGIRDPKFWRVRPKGVRFIEPVHTFTAHSTPLSIRFLRHQPDVKPGSVALVARRGSWNRTKKAGYDVRWVDFHANGKITDKPFLTGFLRGQTTLGRPVDVFEARNGHIYITDDHNNAIYRVLKKR